MFDIGVLVYASGPFARPDEACKNNKRHIITNANLMEAQNINIQVTRISRFG